jgi:hypothetical protein
MYAWIRPWAQLCGVAGAAVVIVAGVALGLSVPAILLRSLVVGVVLWGAVALLGRLVGNALLRAIVAQRVARQQAASEAAAPRRQASEESRRAA